MELRDYQTQNIENIRRAWQTEGPSVLNVLPTGAGKTVVFSKIISNYPGAVCAIAHRQELTIQMSCTLAINGVRHRLISPNSVVKEAVKSHLECVNQVFYDEFSEVAAAGVDTILKREKELAQWASRVTLVVVDEAHHVLKTNKWGRALALFKNARILGVTATPLRADGQGLGINSDGVFNSLIVGPALRDLIDQGYLTEYKIYAPPSDLNLKDVKISKATGDFNPDGLRAACRKSQIVGDVVNHYRRFANNKKGVTFTTDVQTAHDIAQQFNNAGIPARALSAKTKNSDRSDAIRSFRNGELMQLVNVDLFGEGFDLPAIECVSMARPTQSYALYAQQFGRALRIMPGKETAIIIDHVGNVVRHGLPDFGKPWSLDRAIKKRKNDIGEIPLTSCPSCTGVYEKIKALCPYCGHKPTPVGRDSPEFVDGDLVELDEETLERLRGNIKMIDRDDEEYGRELERKHAPRIGIMAGMKRHRINQEAQSILRDSITLWADIQRKMNKTDSESYRTFYYRFGIDVLSAQALKCKDALPLTDAVNKNIQDLQNVLC